MATNRQRFGYATLVDPQGSKECDTFNCAHCQKIVHIPPAVNGKKTMPGGACAACGHKLICDKCVDLGVCTPFLKQIEAVEAANRMYETVLRG